MVNKTYLYKCTKLLCFVCILFIQTPKLFSQSFFSESTFEISYYGRLFVGNYKVNEYTKSSAQNCNLKKLALFNKNTKSYEFIYKYDRNGNFINEVYIDFRIITHKYNKKGNLVSSTTKLLKNKYNSYENIPIDSIVEKDTFIYNDKNFDYIQIYTRNNNVDTLYWKYDERKNLVHMKYKNERHPKFEKRTFYDENYKSRTEVRYTDEMYSSTTVYDNITNKIKEIYYPPRRSKRSSSKYFYYDSINRLKKKIIISYIDFNGSDWPLSSTPDYKKMSVDKYFTDTTIVKYTYQKNGLFKDKILESEKTYYICYGMEWLIEEDTYTVKPELKAIELVSIEYKYIKKKAVSNFFQNLFRYVLVKERYNRKKTKEKKYIWEYELY